MTTRATRRRLHAITVALAVAAVLLAAPAVAQVLVNPVKGNFEHTYVVYGRVVDKDGWPVNQLYLNVLVTGLKGLSVEPVRVETNCNGDFGAAIPLGTIEGRAKVTVNVASEGNEDVRPVKQTQDLDAFYRRNDFTLKLDESWPYSCGQARSYWPTRMTVWGRVVDGVGEHEANGTKLEAQPMKFWPVNMTITTGNETWPPDSLQPTDERGDFKYSWTFQENLTEGDVRVQVGDVVHTATVDPLTRVAFFKVNVGDEPSRTVPAPLPALALLAVGALALAFARRDRRP